MRRRRSQAGFTFFEIAITVAVLGAGLATAMEVLSTSDDLAAQGRAHLRGAARYRRPTRRSPACCAARPWTA